MADKPISCPECGHRNVKHLAGEEACLLPGCPCPVAADKRPESQSENSS